MSSILKSVIITLFISIGFTVSCLAIMPWWQGLALFTTLQIVVSFLWKNYLIAKNNTAVEEIAQDLDEFLTRQQVVTVCPCGAAQAPVNIFPDEELIITCEQCKNNFRASLEVKTQLITEPINMENIFERLKGTSV